MSTIISGSTGKVDERAYTHDSTTSTTQPLLDELVTAGHLQLKGNEIYTWLGIPGVEEKPIPMEAIENEILMLALCASEKAAERLLAWRAGQFSRSLFPRVYEVLKVVDSITRLKFKKALMRQFDFIRSAQSDPDISQLTWIDADFTDPDRPIFNQTFKEIIDANGPWPKSSKRDKDPPSPSTPKETTWLPKGSAFDKTIAAKRAEIRARRVAE